MKPNLRAVDSQVDHPRDIARRRVREFRQGTAIKLDYDFNQQPRELRQVFYDATVRFSRRRWWSKLLR